MTDEKHQMVVSELKRLWPDSIFIDGYDDCIMGVSPATGAICYGEYDTIHKQMEYWKDEFDGDLSDDQSEEWNDFYDRCMDAVYTAFRDYLENYKEGEKIPPVLFQHIDEGSAT